MQLPYTKTADTGCLDLVKENGLNDCYVSPIVFSAYGEMGVNAGKNKIIGAISAWEWGSYLGDEGMEKGIRCTVSSWSRIDPRMMPPHAKCSANYANSILAKMDALSSGYDEAIMLTSRASGGRLRREHLPGEGRRNLRHPPWSGSAGGITRDSVIQIAKDNGIPFREEDFIREDMFTADELFLCGTAANVTPIREVDNRVIGNGKFPVTRKIQQTYLDAIHGKIPKYEPWLSYASTPTIYSSEKA